MARITLVGGAYKTRGLIASAQRCCNLYPEMTAPTAQPPVPVTHLPTPGLTLLGGPPLPAPGRALYRSSVGSLYAVIGDKVYVISSSWEFTPLGTIGTNSADPVSIKDNEQVAVLVDGSSSGYTIDLTTNAFATITDVDFFGATRLDYLDTFMLFNKPGTPAFYSTLSNVIDFDPLYFADMTGEPTNCVSIATVRGYVWVIGETASEVWFNAGDTNVFPFARVPAQIIQQGCLAPYSVAVSSGDDDSQTCILWLAQNPDGGGILLKGRNFEVGRVSTHAIENEWRAYPSISDAVGYVYQQEGHAFYVLTFRAADRSWCLDLTTEEWHERPYIDNNGIEHRHRAACSAYAFGQNLCLDWENGSLYKFDLEAFTDNGQPIIRRRGFPHLVNDGKRVLYARMIADMATGLGDDLTGGFDAYFPPLVSLRYSDDHGKSWGNPVLLSMGAGGDYARSMLATQLGMARDRVFELFWSGEALTALNGAFIEAIPLAS
jgi:hypothetical protein